MVGEIDPKNDASLKSRVFTLVIHVACSCFSAEDFLSCHCQVKLDCSFEGRRNKTLGCDLQMEIVCERMRKCDKSDAIAYHRHHGVISRVAKVVKWFAKSEIANYI